MENIINLPKLSFIVVSHNFELFIEECLQSISKQKYKNIELIVVDDFSQDKTVEKVQNFISNNPDLDVKFIKNQKNIGQLASFLSGLKEATGEFVSQVDGDDVLFEDYALTHIEAHLKTSVAFTSCRHVDIDAHNTLLSVESVDCPGDKENTYNLSCKTEEGLITACLPKKVRGEEPDVKVLLNSKYNFATWHWAPASSAVMRKAACDMLLKLKNPQKIKITSDKFVFSFLHLIGSSAIIYMPLYAYRKHKSNYSLANPVMGSCRYLKTKTQKNYIRNNILIRQTILAFVLSNYKFFKETLNNANVVRIVRKIVFSFDFTTLKSVIKSLFI